jgi:zinc-binding alcohol dehydrogenase family protein
MKAVGLNRYLPISDPQSLVDVEIEAPNPRSRDLLVKVEAISVNPLDTKIRVSKGAEALEAQPRVLGWDAAGTVIATGAEVTLFKPGDAVYYAGSVIRPGANSELHLVDERIVGIKPVSLNFPQASALPLTTITAWEGLFDRLGISSKGEHAGQSVLIIGGAGGVGSIAIQLAKQLGKQTVVATASRPDSITWCRGLGADHVVDHTGDLVAQVRAQGLRWVDRIFCCNSLDKHFPAMSELLAPQGKVCSIVEHLQPLPMNLLRPKCGTFVWEAMFARSTFGTPDMIEQHKLLTETARLIDAGVLKTTLGEVLGPINAANLRRAHAALEGGHTVGKLVLAGF